MKLAKFTVEFLRHVLANDTVESKRDVFQHAGDGSLVFKQSWWYSAFSAALPGTGLRGIKPGHICMDLIVDAKTQRYYRHYGKGQVRVHEAIMPGTKVTFQALVEDHVTESALRTLLDRVGRFVGLSPYGHKLGYGKFLLVTVEVGASEAAGVKRTNEPEGQDGHPAEDRRP